jgi:D-amino peptidase
MEPGAAYVTGRGRPRAAGFTRAFDGVILLGYHAMKGTHDGVLNHTQSSKSESRYWYNSVESGEIAQVALLAGSMDIPVIMQVGDKASNREARKFLGRHVVTVATKKGFGRESAELYPFEETRAAIYKGAQKAVVALPECKPYRIKMPIKARREWIVVTENPSETRVETREATLKDAFNVVKF